MHNSLKLRTALLIIAVLAVIVACGPSTAAPTTAPVAPTTAPAAATPTKAAAAATTAPVATTAASTTGLPADAAPADKQVLKVAWQGFGSQEPLAPWSVRWGGQAIAINEFLSPVYHDVDFNPRPLLAESLTSSADKKTWTIKINPKAVWSDGTPVTAQDMKDAWDWITLPAQKTSNITGYALADAVGFKDVADGKAPSISGLVAKDAGTLEIQLNNPDSYLNHKLSIYYMGIVPAKELKADPNYLTKPNPRVNGPYQVTQIDATGRNIVMSRNPKWWGEKPAFERIELVVAEELATFEALVEKGQVDFAYSFGDINARRKLAARTPGARLEENLLPFGLYASFHVNAAPVDDLNVRKALIHSINFKELAAAATEGTQKEWLGLLHPDLQLKCYSTEHEKYFEYNVAKAKEFLAASKYKTVDGLGKLRVSSNSTGAAQKKGIQIIMEYWRTNLGITDVEFKEQPSGFGPDEAKLNLDRQSIGARPPNDQVWMSVNMKSTQIHATRFFGGYKNDTLDKLVDVIASLDPKDSTLCAKIKEAEKTFLEDYVLVPMWRQSGDFAIAQPWVKNVKLSPYLAPYGWFGGGLPQGYITNAKK
ncbi:MAG: ABC transporter substrate-binding protein [Chloroflexi bacterium]|nr:ABC transporter substrate-binding protein [Chloroflexota bacterium]